MLLFSISACKASVYTYVSSSLFSFPFWCTIGFQPRGVYLKYIWVLTLQHSAFHHHRMLPPAPQRQHHSPRPPGTIREAQEMTQFQTECRRRCGHTTIYCADVVIWRPWACAGYACNKGTGWPCSASHYKTVWLQFVTINDLIICHYSLACGGN
jgi:hypothetical protein